MNFLSNFFEKMKKNKTTTAIGNGILYNKFILYFILFISFTDLLYYAIAKKYIFIFIFFIIGYLTQFFSKNMTVIMCIALAFTNILSFGTSNISIVNEGFQEGATTKSKKDKTTDEITDKLEEIEEDELDMSLENKMEDSGIEGLSDKTKELMKTQKELMKNMETLKPMLAQAEGFLEKFKNK